MKSHRILSAALLLCTLAACGQNPAGSDPQAQSAGASYDSGYTMGSGNSAATASGYTIGSGSRAEEEEEGGFVIGSGNTEGESDGGVGFGSGNEEDGEAPTGQTTTERSGYTMGSGN